MRKLITSVLVAGYLLGFGNPVTAIPLTWNVNATFSDSATLTGSYVYDAETSIYSSWNLTTTAGDQVGRNYNPGNTIELFGGDPQFFLFIGQPGYSYYIQLSLLTPMTNLGGVISLYAQSCDTSIYFVDLFLISCSMSRSGEGTVTADVIETPEPTTLSLLGLGLLGFGLSRRKKV